MPGAIDSASGSPMISLRPHPNASAARGLHDVTLPVGPTVKKRPSSSQVVSSAAFGFCAAGLAAASGACPASTAGISSLTVSIAFTEVKALTTAHAAHAYLTRRQSPLRLAAQGGLMGRVSR